MLPPAGYKKGDPPERHGEDFFPYRPYHLAASPPRPALATLTNAVQKVMSSGRYAGAVWTQGSPRIEETLYWLNLLIDTTAPICGTAAQRQHGMIGNEGDKNIVDAIEYIVSRAWADEQGRNRVGVVLIADQRVFAARDVQKADARPGGFTVTGGHGGLLGAVGHEGPPLLTYIPTRRHTFQSEVNISRLPREVRSIKSAVQIKNDAGEIVEGAIPKVAIVKEANYGAERAGGQEDDSDLARYPLSGFVVEGHSPYGTLASGSRAKLLKSAVERGMPVVTVGRGNNEGFSAPHAPFLGGRNLTATKARLLLMACLMRFGAPRRELLPEYQKVFDSH